MNDSTEKKSGLGLIGRIWTEGISTFLVLLLLLLTLLIGTGEMIHGQMLRIGERLYGDEKIGMQYSFLRAEPSKPSCDRNPNIDTLVQERMKAEASDPDASFFGVTPEADVRQSFLAAKTECEEKFAFYDKSMTHLEKHPSIRTYRSMETGFFWLFKFGTENRVLILLFMVMISAITASLKMHHISLRPPTTRLDFRVYAIAMILGNGLLTYSVWSQYQSVINSGVESTYETIWGYWLWLVLFVSVTLISLYQLFLSLKLPKKVEISDWH